MHTTSTAARPSSAPSARHAPPQDRTAASSATVRQAAQSASDDSHDERQMDLLAAIAAGDAGMAQATDAAERRDPEFRTKAEQAFLRHLAACPDRSAWGEDLTDIARAHGCSPKDDRAFGAVFQSLARRGLIRCVEFGVRRKGRGTAGARRWALCQ